MNRSFSHNDSAWLSDAGSDALVRCDHGSIDEELVLDLDVPGGDRESVDADPLADGVLPADDRALDQPVATDFGPLHHSRIVNTLTWPHSHASTDYHVRPQLCRGIYLGSWVDQNVALDGRACSQTLRLLVSQRV